MNIFQRIARSSVSVLDVSVAAMLMLSACTSLPSTTGADGSLESVTSNEGEATEGASADNSDSTKEVDATQEGVMLPPEAPSFSTSNWATDFSRRTIEWSDVLSGGAQKDGIQKGI